jgi:tripartite-type tricarboxylate transporter receptor subunit TctC
MKSNPCTRAFAFGALALAMPYADAQTYPARPVRIITPLPIGSGADAALRLAAEQLSRAWSQTVVVENRPGASGFIALGLLKSASADGYNLALASSSHLTTHPLLYKKLPYDPVRDFAPVIPLFTNYFFIAAPAGSPWRGVADLIAAAKVKPGALSYASGFVGSPAHLGAAALEAATGTQMLHVPYKETTQLFVALGNGEIGWTLASPGTAGAAVQTGKVRLLAVAAPSRLPAYKDVPTVAEAGGPKDYEVSAWTGLIAPAGTPAAVIDKVNRDIARAVADARIRERYAVFGYEPYVMTPAQMAKLMAAETARYAPVIQRLNLALD